MRIAWAGSTPSNTPIWVADQKGFFKKNGLQAEVIAISASTIVIQALLTGEVDFIIAPSATLVSSRLAGADTAMVSTNLPLFIDHIVSIAEITGIEQLKGKIGGVNRLTNGRAIRESADSFHHEVSNELTYARPQTMKKSMSFSV